MRHALFTWELGASLGHIGIVSELIRRLLDRGIRVSVAASDLSNIAGFLPGAARLYQAPVWRLEAVGLPRTTASYAEILAHHGYLSETGLCGLIRAWRSLFEAAKPDLLVAESSPTALLAARGSPFPKVILGHGFAIPPRAAPFPPLIRVDSERWERCTRIEARILETVNGALTAMKAQALQASHEILEADATLLCTFPELDHSLSLIRT